MKIILLKNVPKVGKKDEIVEVAEGFARNSLLPRGLAIIADEKNIQSLNRKKETNELKTREEKEQRISAYEKLKNTQVVISAPHNKEGSLFKKVSAKDIVLAVKDQFEIELKEDDLELKNGSFKQTGEYQIKSRQFPNQTFTINIQ